MTYLEMKFQHFRQETSGWCFDTPWHLLFNKESQSTLVLEPNFSLSPVCMVTSTVLYDLKPLQLFSVLLGM